MSRRHRAIAAAVAVAIHLAAFAPLANAPSHITDNVFRPEAEAILDGARPYSDRNFEYPPLALPIIVGPAWATEGESGYRQAFAWQMIAFDLAIVLLLTLALPGSRARVVGALGAYSIGVIALSGILMPDSAIEAAPLALARFDLVPAALVLAAVLAREAGRSALWSALLAVATAVKAFAILLYAPLLRGERHPKRVAFAALPPIAAAAILVLAFGDQFGSAIDYHSGRELQVEAVAATPLAVAHLLGAEASTEIGAGSYNIDAPGAGIARALTIALLIASIALIAWQSWRRRVPPLPAATALLAAAVVFAPVLSPQFLFWVLPLSAAAYGLRAPNLVLLAAIVLTQIELHYYGGVGDLSARFVLPLAARNLLLLVYLALVVAPLVRPPEDDRGGPERRPSTVASPA